MLDDFKEKDDLGLLYKAGGREKIDNSKMEPIFGNVKLVKCKRLEELEEGLDLIITHISVQTYCGKERYTGWPGEREIIWEMGL